MRVLVTGGTGFTGTALVKRLRAAGQLLVELVLL
jgi:nucleoside-diphosphate-sugar epimerase